MTTFLKVLRVTPLWLAPLGLAITGMAILSGDAAGGHSPTPRSPSAEFHSPTPQNFKVAFIGDQGLGSNAVAVLNLIRDEGTDMVLHQGDLGYTIDANAWDQQINNVLGNNFPYFASVGNHDCIGSVGCNGPGQWTDYQQKLLARLGRVDDATCIGDLGVNSACSYRGLFFVLSGAGTLGTDHGTFIRDQLAADNSIWRICSWHKNQRLMQVGYLGDDFGWGPYDECRKGGSIIATGHHHSYSRTYLMDGFETQSIASTSTTLKIEKGTTFAFVSGLGEHSIHRQNNELAANPWWAAVYTSAQGANFGALFCTFNKDGVESRAHCYFKDIDGKILDEFDLEVAVHSLISVPAVSTIGLGTLTALLMASMFWHLRQGGRRLRTR